MATLAPPNMVTEEDETWEFERLLQEVRYRMREEVVPGNDRRDDRRREDPAVAGVCVRVCAGLRGSRRL